MTGDIALISTADIARLAGQSRSTVGNWKARHADFPAAVSRTSRGPLYDRTEVEQWLQRTNRALKVDTEARSAAAIAADGGPPAAGAFSDPQDILSAVVFLAVRQHCTDDEWAAFVPGAPDLAGDTIRAYIRSKIPLNESVTDGNDWSPPPGELRRILAEISDMDVSEIAKTVDGLLDTYLASEIGSRAVRVPPAVRSLMAGLANPGDSDVIYQAGPGLAQIAVQAAKPHSAQKLYVQELTDRGAGIASLNIEVHDLDATVASGDIFTKDAFPELRAECVVCTPPWDPRAPHLADNADDPRWVWGEPGINDSHFAWIQHCLYHLADGAGHAVILVPNSALAGRGRSARIRRRIVQADLLRAVISLPPGALPGTQVRGAVLVFSRTPTPDDWGILMVDLADKDRHSSALPVILDSLLVAQTVATYRDWIRGGAGTGWIGVGATAQALAANDYVLDPARYQPVVGTDVSSGEQMIRTYVSMSYRLEALLAAGREIDDQLKEKVVNKG
jgi:predicted DNA-binding transcriptional regulator AlpA